MILFGAAMKRTAASAPPKNDIKCQTETGPPTRYPSVVDEQVMDQVKNSVPDNGSGD